MAHDPHTILARLRRGISFADMAVGFLFVVFVSRALLMPAASDTFWHLRAGGDILRTGAVPRVETYSFTAAGWPWRDHEWLWQPISYVCHRLGGMPLLTLCGATFVVAALVLVHRLMVGPTWTRFALLLVGLPLTIPVWTLRPQLFTLLAVPLLVTLLARERLWPIPLLFVVWANMHGAVALGGIILGAATAVAVLRWRIHRTPADRRRALRLAIVLPLAAAACLATPLGTGMFHFLADSMVRIRAIKIGEWQPTLPTQLYGAIFWVLAVGFLATLVVRRRALRDGHASIESETLKGFPNPPAVVRGEQSSPAPHASSWADWTAVTGALALLPLASVAVRNVTPFLLLAIPATSRLLGPDAHIRLRLPWRKTAEAGADADRPRANLALLAGLSVAALVFVVWSYRTEQPSLGWRPIDERALAAVRACDGPLYNQYDDGAYLIWFVPEKPVFVDNRVDPYPLEHITAQLDVQWERAPYRPLFDKWGIRCAFLPVTSSTVAALERDGWLTRFRDDRYIVQSAPAGAR